MGTDEPVVMEEAIAEVQNPLVAITFQKNVDRKKKYLEAEPKALGVPSVPLCKRPNDMLEVAILKLWALSLLLQITQIGLSAFQMIFVSVFLAKELSSLETDIPFFIASLLVGQ